MFRYNAGMQKENREKTQQSKEPLIGTVVVIGGFVCALLLSRVRIHGLHTPLSLGLLLGSQLAGFDPAAIVGGVILGAFAGEQPYWQGVSTALLYWGITRIVLLARKKCSSFARFGIFLICGSITLPITALSGKGELLYGVISLAGSLLSALVFRRICLSIKTMTRARIVTDVEQIAAVLGIGMLLLTASDAVLERWSFSVMLLLLLAACAVTIRGVFGAAAGILWSVMLTLYAGSDPILIGSVALGSLTAAAARDRGKPFVIGAFFLSGLLFQTFRIPDAYSMSAPNLIGGSLLFLMIPKSWLAELRRCCDAELYTESLIAETIERTERRASREVERMGKLLGGFSGMFHTAQDSDDVVGKWTAQGALAICRGCEVRRLCWKDAGAMHEAILTLAKEAGDGNRVEPIPPIDENCRHFSDLCASVLLSYQQATNRNAVSRRAQDQSDFAERQFSGAGAALCTYARQMRNRSYRADHLERGIRERLIRAGYVIESLELYRSNGTDLISVALRRPIGTKHSAVRQEMEQACGYRLRCIRVAQSKRRVSFRFEQDARLHVSATVSRMPGTPAISGDATGECRIPGGRVCFALSDGMGSGKEARMESEAAIRLLFRLCHAGVQKELVYENVNRMLLAQNEAEMYATLDAVSIDLNSGEAELLKYGAPPSYLLRDGEVRTITGEALPCGILAEAKPSVIHLQLQKNDRIILCSDGVQDGLPLGTEQTLLNLNGIETETGEQLCRLAKQNGGSDDMTVMVISVA